MGRLDVKAATGVCGQLAYGRASLIDLDRQPVCRDEKDSWHVNETKQRVLLIVRRRHGRTQSMALHPVEVENLWALLDHWERNEPERYKLVRAALDEESTRKLRWR